MEEKRKTKIIRIVIIVIVAIIAFIYYMSEVRPFPYEGYDAAVSNFQRYDAELNEAIVLTRFGTIKHYDPIVQALNSQTGAIQKFKDTLKKHPNKLISQKLALLEESVSKKHALTQRFQRINPILTNAIAQFSTNLSQTLDTESNNELIESFEQQTAQSEKNIQINKANNLFRGILIYVSHKSQDLNKDLSVLVNEIEKAPKDVQLAHMEIVINYARKILELQPQMTTIDAALFQIPVVTDLQALNRAYEDAQNQFIKQGDTYRIVLYVMVITLLSLLRWTFARLQNTVVVLHKEVKQRIAAQEELAETNRELENRVAERTQELTVKNRDLNQAMSDLKEAQDQLIVKEKMASVGMLTTGIAHEIKNPLNFVNNFSEISIDLVSELNQELESNKEKLGDAAIGYIQDILSDLKTNCSKIKEHGVRADNIVKMMLMHSQEAGVQKEMINLHNLLDDNLRIAIESFSSAQGKFDITIDKQLDPQVDEILAAPQTLGRAFIYIIDNSLYAMKEKQQKLGLEYVPTLTIKTLRKNDYVEISFKDNGTGIPKQNIDRVFEPFFTTKPTGKGNTGLGLSICYDTVVKQHKGEIRVTSEEGVGSEFIVLLPLKAVASQ